MLGRCNKGHPFWVSNPQQSTHMSYLSIFFRYIFVGQKKIVSVPYNLPPTLWESRPISLAKDFTQTGLCFGVFMRFLLSMATPMSLSRISLAILVRFSCCVTGWGFPAKFSWTHFSIKVGVSFTWLCTFLIHFWFHVL